MTMANITLEKCHTAVTSLWHADVRDAKTLHNQTFVPLSTIYDYLKKLKMGYSLDPLPRSGRPKKLTSKKRHHLGQLISQNKYSTCSELKNTLNQLHPNLNVSSRTVLNELYNLKYHCTILKTILFLITIHKQRCVEWAMKHQDQNWKQVIFSDETTFQMFQNTQKVFYKIGTQPSQKPMVKHSYKVHAWGAFSAKGSISLLLFTGIMDSAFYREILNENLFDNANTVMERRWIFQQDNDPKHKARETMDLLAQKCPRILEWPSNSPDLNLIENLWSILKSKVEKQVNNLVNKKKSVSVDSFLEIILKEWEGIDHKVYVNLVNSMPARLEWIIEGNGNKIPY